MPGGGRIDGTLARDLSNTGNQWETGTYAANLPPNPQASFSTTLQAGLLMGKVTTGGKYRNSIIGAVGTAVGPRMTNGNVYANLVPQGRPGNAGCPPSLGELLGLRPELLATVLRGIKSPREFQRPNTSI